MLSVKNVKKLLHNASRRAIITSAKYEKGEKQMKYECTICGYTYDEELGDPDNGIEPGTLWEDLPKSFACPLCGVEKCDFQESVE